MCCIAATRFGRGAPGEGRASKLQRSSRREASVGPALVLPLILGRVVEHVIINPMDLMILKVSFVFYLGQWWSCVSPIGPL